MVANVRQGDGEHCTGSGLISLSSLLVELKISVDLPAHSLKTDPGRNQRDHASDERLIPVEPVIN